MKNQFKNSESGFALVATIVLLLFIGLTLSAGMVGVGSQMRLQNERLNSQESFYSAESGVSSAISQIRQSPDLCLKADPDNETPLIVNENIYKDADQSDLFGQFTVSIIYDGLSATNGWDTCWIRSTGLNSLGGSPRTIYVKVSLQNPSKFMILTMGDLQVQEGANIAADILGKNVTLDPGNGQITLDNGTTEPTTVYFLQNRSVINTTNGQINGDYNFQNIASFTFPVVDNNYFRNLAKSLEGTGQGLYANSNLIVDLSNLEQLKPNNDADTFNPAIIFAEGHIRIQGEYSDSILIVSGKNINISGDITAKANNFGLQDPQIGLLASQNVRIIQNHNGLSKGEDIKLDAFIMADGQGTADGVFQAQGTAGSLGTLEFKGSMAVRGQGNSLSAIDMSAFQNRQYSFNNDFNVNRTIPYLPFSVNVLEWREVEDVNLEPFPPSSNE